MNRENRKVTRVKLDQPLSVVLCSIGGQIKYELMTRDISHSGFFLEFDKPGRFPFNEASIMEVWLSLGEGNTLFFNGKMARVVKPGDEAEQDTGTGIAIKIVQISQPDEIKLKEFIDSASGSQIKEPLDVA